MTTTSGVCMLIAAKQNVGPLADHETCTANAQQPTATIAVMNVQSILLWGFAATIVLTG